MAAHECPRCGSPKATTVMLPPAKGSQDARPHPAFRCMVCDTQWSDDQEWARVHAEHAQHSDEQAETGEPGEPEVSRADA